MLTKSKYFILFLAVTIISAIFLNGCSEDDSPLEPAEEHFEAIGILFYNSGIKLAQILRGETADTLYAPVGAKSDHINVKFYNEDEEIVDPPESEHHTLAWEIEDESVVSVWQHPGEEGGFEFHLEGLKEGTTKIEFFIMHEDHSDYRSGQIPVKVINEEGAHGDPVGLKLYDEESGDVLVTVNADGSVTGSLTVSPGDTTDHIEVSFFDENNVEFEPPSPEHSLGYQIADEAVAGIVPPESEEPWAFHIIGKATGLTTIVLMLKHEDSAEYTSSQIPINVQ